MTYRISTDYCSQIFTRSFSFSLCDIDLKNNQDFSLFSHVKHLNFICLVLRQIYFLKICIVQKMNRKINSKKSNRLIYMSF